MKRRNIVLLRKVIAIFLILLIQGPLVKNVFATTESVIDSYIIDVDNDDAHYGVEYFEVIISGESIIKTDAEDMSLAPDDSMTINYDDDGGGGGSFYLTSGGDSVMTANSAGTITVHNSMTTNGIDNGNDGITNVGSVSGVTSLTASGTISGSSLSASGFSTLNGINNGGDGITNAGAVSGVTTLTTSGATTLGSTLGVSGNTTLSTVSTSGLATLNSASVTNNATVGGTMGVSGNLTAQGATNTIGTAGFIGKYAYRCD